MKTNILIIGAGPSGIVALKEMREAGLDALVVEKASAIGGAFRDDAGYGNMYLNVSNRQMCFSDFPDPDRTKYSSRAEYLEYLRSYVAHFNLYDRFHFNTSVLQARLQDDKWQVTLQKDGKHKLSMEAERLIVATGCNHQPNVIPLPGYLGEILHSSNFKGASSVAGKRVLVIGIGESSADICADVAHVAKTCMVWSRRPFIICPRYLSHKSADEIQVMSDPNEQTKVWELSETITTSRLSSLQSAKGYNATRRLFWGEANKSKSPTFKHLVAIYENGAKCAVEGIMRSEQLYLVTKSTRMVSTMAEGKLDLIVAKEASFEGTKVTFSGCIFKNGKPPKDSSEEFEADVIILCTGFKTNFAWLQGAEIDWSPRKWFKHCIPPGYEQKLAFLGWTRPHQGGIPAVSEMLSRYLALLYTNQRDLPTAWEMDAYLEGKTEDMYYKETPQYQTLVDYPSLMTSLARLIGCEPKPPSIFNIQRFIQYYTFPFWPLFYRTHGHGAQPWALDQVLSKHYTFEGLGPQLFYKHIWFSGVKQAFFNPSFYFFTQSFARRSGMENGWYWAKSKGFVLHGVEMRKEDLVPK